MRVSVPRLHSVRFKDGRAPIRIFRAARADDCRTQFISDTEEIASHRLEIAGYAVVAWTREGDTSVSCETSGPPIPLMMLPEFVKTSVLDYLHSVTSKK